MEFKHNADRRAYSEICKRTERHCPAHLTVQRTVSLTKAHLSFPDMESILNSFKKRMVRDWKKNVSRFGEAFPKKDFIYWQNRVVKHMQHYDTLSNKRDELYFCPPFSFGYGFKSNIHRGYFKKAARYLGCSLTMFTDHFLAVCDLFMEYCTFGSGRINSITTERDDRMPEKIMAATSFRELYEIFPYEDEKDNPWQAWILNYPRLIGYWLQIEDLAAMPSTHSVTLDFYESQYCNIRFTRFADGREEEHVVPYVWCGTPIQKDIYSIKLSKVFGIVFK